MTENFNLNTMIIGEESQIPPSNDPGQSLKNAKSTSIGKREARALVRIFSTSAEDRTLEDIIEMKECLRKVKFLQDYRQSPHFEDLLRNLQLENYNQEKVLFKQFDEADKFYIILNGVIGLYIRAPNSVETFLKPTENDEQQQKIQNKNEQVRNRDQGSENVGLNDTEGTQEKIAEDQQNNKIEKDKPFINSQPNKNENQRLSFTSQASKAQSFLGVGVREVARLQSGETFGELGLLFKEKRSATAICLDSTSLLVLKKEVFEKYLGKNAGGKVSMMVEFYQSLWQMRQLTTKEIIQLSTKTTLTECRQTTVVIRQGEKPKGLFFVRKGTVKILTTLKFKISSKDFRYETEILQDPSLFYTMDLQEPTQEEIRNKKYRKVEVQVDEIGDGGIFGDYEAFQGGEVPFTAITSNHCDVLAVSLNDLRQSIPDALFKEFAQSARKYPTDDKIKKQYVENLLWAAFKNDLVQSWNNETINNIRSQNLSLHRQPFLPKVSLAKYALDSSQDQPINLDEEQESDKNQNNQKDGILKSTQKRTPSKKNFSLNLKEIDERKNFNQQISSHRILPNTFQQNSGSPKNNSEKKNSNIFSSHRESNQLSNINLNSASRATQISDFDGQSNSNNKLKSARVISSHKNDQLEESKQLTQTKAQSSKSISQSFLPTYLQLKKNKYLPIHTEINKKGELQSQNKMSQSHEFLNALLSVDFSIKNNLEKRASTQQMVYQEANNEEQPPNLMNNTALKFLQQEKNEETQKTSPMTNRQNFSNFTHISNKFQSSRLILPKVNKLSRVSILASQIY